MPINFPPEPLYPDDFDSDRTLFKVYNTTETVITSDNPAWSEEIFIRPQKATDPEIWADNGFATISGEMLYYDSVEKNDNNRVFKLKRCVRNIAGKPTKFNVAGTDIRSFVVAETHKAIVEAINRIEKFLGTAECDDTNTLTCCLNEIDLPACEEDGDCPSVDFDYQVVSEDNCEGTVINYQVGLTGTFTSFRLDFGDGTFTTTPNNGQKKYAPGASIDPVLTVGNNNCELVVTGIERAQSLEPQRATPAESLTLPAIEINLPAFNPISPEIPSPDLSMPPLIQPCIDLDPIDISIGPISIGDISIPPVISIIPPSIPNPISIVPPIIPTTISIVPPIIPTTISIVPPVIPTTISIVPPVIPTSISIIPPHIPTSISIIPPVIPTSISIIPPNIPTSISIIPPHIPSVISIIPPTLNPISIIPPTINPISITPPTLNPISITANLPSTITLVDHLSDIQLIDNLHDITLIDNLHDISLIVPAIPDVTVDWGTPPELTCTVTISCPAGCGAAGGGASMAMNSFFDGEEDVPLAALNVDYDFAGIPSEIVVLPPDIPPIQIEENIPRSITVVAPHIPDMISVVGMFDLPSKIQVEMPSVFPEIKIDAAAIPATIPIDWGEVPSLKVEFEGMPSTISVFHDIPSTIFVEGMVDTISVQGFPDYIPLRLENPDDLVVRLAPAELTVKLDVDKLITTDGQGQHCFALVPCSPN